MKKKVWSKISFVPEQAKNASLYEVHDFRSLLIEKNKYCTVNPICVFERNGTERATTWTKPTQNKQTRFSKKFKEQTGKHYFQCPKFC